MPKSKAKVAGAAAGGKTLAAALANSAALAGRKK
jgi:hypothetical protein